MTATYADRITVHPDRYGARKTYGPNLWAVLHTSEGPEHDNAAEQLAGFFGRPGDRDNGRGGRYGSSYHVIFDTDRIIPAVPYDTVAYSAAGGNARGIHGCFPGRADQTRQQWLTGTSRQMITQCAAWLLDLQAVEHIDLTIIQPPDLQAGRSGVCDHFAVSLAFRRSTHTDVGIGFPWDVLYADVADLLTPPQQENHTMLYIAKPTFPGVTPNTPHVAVFASGLVRRATNADYAYAKRAGVAVLDLDSADQHAEMVASFGGTK